MKIALVATILLIGQTLGFGYVSQTNALPLNLSSLNLNLGNGWETISGGNNLATLQKSDQFNLKADSDNSESENANASVDLLKKVDESAQDNDTDGSDQDNKADGSDQEAAEESTSQLNMSAEGGAQMNISGDAQLSLEGELRAQSVQQGQTTVTSGKTILMRGPTVIRQQLVQQPIIRQRIVQQPIIKRRVVQKQLNKSQQTLAETQTNNVQKRSVDITVPAKQIFNNETIQPTLLTRNTQINFNRGGETVVNKDAIINALKTQNENRVRVENAPAQQIYHHQRIQPTLLTVNDKVNLVQLPDREVNYDQVVRPTENRVVNRRQPFNVDANEIVSKTTIKPQLLNVNTKLDVAQSPDVNVNKNDIVLPVQNSETTRVQNAVVPAQRTFVQPVIQYIINENETHHVHKPVFKRVPYLKQVTVPTTILQKNPVVKRVPVPVRTQAQAMVKSREYAFNVAPSGEASTGFVQRQSFNLGTEGVPVEINGGKAEWELATNNETSQGGVIASEGQAFAQGAESSSADDNGDDEKETKEEKLSNKMAEIKGAIKALNSVDASVKGDSKLNANVFNNNLEGGWTYIGSGY